MDAYGVRWSGDPLWVELEFCRAGGYLIVQGVQVGMGYKHHYKEFLKYLAPWFRWQIYSDMIVDAWLNYSTVGIMGPASCSKTTTAALIAYGEFVIHPQGTSILASSTDIKGLKRRIYGQILKCIREATSRHPQLPGYPVDSAHTIFPAEPTPEDIREPKDAIMGVACKQGGQYVGLGNYVGIHNERVFLFADEASLMPRAFYDSISNLASNPIFKMMAMGNPIGEGDSLDLVCEPAVGGWDGHEDSNRSRTWKARGNRAVGVQLSGLDSPNFNYPRGLNPFRGIITPEFIEDTKLRYGEDSWQYNMMALGKRPKGAGSRRVITRIICEKGNAFGEPLWDERPTTDYGCLDAAYSGVGGDRTPFMHVKTGWDIHGVSIFVVHAGPFIIPVNPGAIGPDGKPMTPEDQITLWVMDYCTRNRIPPARFGFDSTGRGTLVSSMSRLWDPGIVPIEFGGMPDERRARNDRPELECDLYGKRVTALWFAGRNLIECGQSRNLPMSVFEEGTYREYFTHKSEKKVDVEPKDVMRTRLGRSPDLFDTYVVGIELARRNGFEIGGNNRAVRKAGSNKWLADLAGQYRALVNREAMTTR